jgi:hypothetical protein
MQKTALVCLLALVACARSSGQTGSEPATSSSASSSGKAASSGPCPERSGARTCSAKAFQKGWSTTAVADRFGAFPPGKYRVDGAVTKLEPSDKSKGQTGDLRVYLKGESGDVGLVFRVASPDFPRASKLEVGATVAVVCDFYGLEEIGVVTFDDCGLP